MRMDTGCWMLYVGCMMVNGSASRRYKRKCKCRYLLKCVLTCVCKYNSMNRKSVGKVIKRIEDKSIST